MPAIATPLPPYAMATGPSRRRNEKGLLNGKALIGAIGLQIVAMKAARATAPLKGEPPFMLTAGRTEVKGG